MGVRGLLAVLVGAGLLLTMLAVPAPAADTRVRGTLRGGGATLEGFEVTLYATNQGASGQHTKALRTTLSDASGRFAFSLPNPVNPGKAVLYVIARGSPQDAPGAAGVVLASVLGTTPVPGQIIVDERTTVATAYGMAQFLEGDIMSGDSQGMRNAVKMTRNLVHPSNAQPSHIAVSPPNGSDTSALATLNSLANVVASCVEADANCDDLEGVTTPTGQSAPTGTLEAMVNLARNPAVNTDATGVFDLSFQGPTPFADALGPTEEPDAWMLALRFVGDGVTMDGPGNFAIDADGTVWTTNNYQYSPEYEPVCGADTLLAFTPKGNYLSGSPFWGGGLSGAGFGITVAPDGHVWVGNFGFAAPEPDCPADQQPPHNSMSEFTPDGTPVSGDEGWRRGKISWPQSTVSDRDGDIWIANCGNDSVTVYRDGDPKRWENIPGTQTGLEHPFGIALGADGKMFVTGNASNNVAVLRPDGTPTPWSPVGEPGDFVFPLAASTDIRGNVWISSSRYMAIPCGPVNEPVPTDPGWLMLLKDDGKVIKGPFDGGGLSVPWGNAVDGANNLWVANFEGQRLAKFCGVGADCPEGLATGDPISPDAGYSFDGLVRNTGVAIDRSGNVWVANNWKEVPLQSNPGGYEVVVVVGAADPIETPIFGPPVPTA